jgi:hypothetical protein
VKRETLVTIAIFVSFLALSASTQAQVSFFQPPTYAGTGATFVADFNGDGKLDILTSDGTMNLGNGDGTFKPGTAVSGGTLAVADFNGDGKPDILQQGPGTLLVLLGNGDGTFQAPISTASGASLSVVAAGDLNGDGKADVVGVSDSALLVYVSNGNGTFAAGVPYTVGATTSGETGVSLGDFNGDQITDIVVTNSGASQEVFFPGKGDGTFGAPTTSTGVSGPACAVVGDFNGDGKLDLAVSCYADAPNQHEVYILLGNGDGTFQTPIAGFPGNGALAAADVNGDGKLDLILQQVEGAGPEITAAQTYLGNGDGTFSNASNYILALPTSSNVLPSLGVVIGDFNSDGKLDVAAGNAVLLSNGNGTFQGIQYGPGGGGFFVIGDFDKSGTPGLAAVGSDINIYRNSGGGMLSLTQSYIYQGWSTVEGIVTADFNGDGNPDLVVSAVDPVSFLWSYSVLIGNGDGTFQAPVYYPQSSAVRNYVTSVIAADFRNNQKVDVAIAGVDSQSFELLLGNGDGTFAAPVAVFDNGGNLLSADFNGDGKQDIATGGPPTGILLGNGNGTFQPVVLPTNLNNFAARFVSDLNNDGKPDLISSNQVALGNGDGTFTPLPVLPGDYLSVIAVGDVNGDGKPDLLVVALVSNSWQSGMLLGNGDGTFGPLISVPTNGLLPSSALIADMNADGSPDIIFPWGEGYGVLLNTTPAGFEVSASAASPAPVTAGNSATSTVSVIPTFGFSGSVVLSCAGFPSGASCGFNPSTIAGSSGRSTLTLTTTTSTAAGTYPVQVQGVVGSIVNSSAVSLVVQAAPDFSINPGSGSSTSQTVSAGQTASFSLSLAGSGTFSGTVNLSCAITPATTLGPTCSLSSSSEQISGTTAQSVTLKVGTTAPSTTAMRSPVGLPPGALPWRWVLLCATMLVGFSWLPLQSRKRAPVLVAPVLMLAMLSWVACGGSGSSSSQSTQGTSAGTYTASVTATSGSLTHTTAFTVTVQ